MLHRHTDDQRVPVLRLSGLWLEQLGFSIGSKPQITARAGDLVVSMVDPGSEVGCAAHLRLPSG
ncbi:SymE family type I addiction module toxin [Xanthomonas bonasiae]|uniref:SymE family type I addiction module toxin n=1 Tax=Xanthomonas bonasiae TaxID=2810351 RepID=UPI0038780CD5